LGLDHHRHSSRLSKDGTTVADKADAMRHFDTVTDCH
jgi:hypothetical protein